VGFFANLFRARPKPAINVEDGLDYRVVGNFKVEVLISPKWLEDGCDDTGKPKRRTVSAIEKLNATAKCVTESEASGVLAVLENMTHFCEHCGEEVSAWEKKCDECKKPLWKGSKKLEMVVVHLMP
jgi:hypothetical protein